MAEAYRGRIGRRLVVSFAVLVMGVVGVCGWVLYRLTQAQLERQMSEHLIGVAMLTAEGLDGDVVLQLRPEYGIYRRLQAQLATARDLVGAARMYVFDRQGHSLLDTEPGVPTGRPYPRLAFDRMELQAVWQGQPAHSVRFQDADGVDYKTGYAPVFAGDRVVAAVGVEIGVGFLSAIRTFKQSVYVLGGLSALLTVGVAFALGRSLTGPIYRLVDAAQEIGRGHLSQPIQATSQDELGYLGQTLEEMRRQLLARDEQLRQMLAGVAHEIRNPLGGIELYAGLIASDLDAADPRKALILKVIGEVRTLNQVISDFLTFARPTPAHPEPVAIAQVVDEVGFLMAPEMEAARVDFHADVPGEVMLYADAGQLKRALLNLAKNAVQAMPDGGRLSVAVHKDKGQVALCVTDTGTGIAEAHIARLFEPFYTTREQGSGLGLAIVRQAVVENGGEIFVESREGKGTTFRLIFPEKNREVQA